jgi:hypothetical protein
MTVGWLQRSEAGLPGWDDSAQGGSACPTLWNVFLAGDREKSRRAGFRSVEVFDGKVRRHRYIRSRHRLCCSGAGVA